MNMTLELELQTLWAALVFYVLAGTVAIFGVVLQKKPERAVLCLLLVYIMLKSPVGYRFRIGPALLWNLAAGLALEVGHTAARLAGRYDVARVASRP